MSTLALTKTELKEAIETLYGLMCSGATPKDIIDQMGIDAEDLERLRAAMLDDKADELRKKPTEHVYVEYMIKQSQNLSDLDHMIQDFKKTRQYNALVGAVRAKSDILDKVVTKGQEFGIIDKQPERREIVAGVVVANLSNAELKNKIVGELSSLGKLMKRYEDKPITEVDVPPTHYEAPMRELNPAAAAPRRTKANNHKVNGGRRVIP